MIDSCKSKMTENQKRELRQIMKGDNVDSIINAINKIKDAKDTSMIDALLYNPYDPRITHRLSMKGKSIYQLKMESLEILTGVAPPKKINYIPDSIIINFYIKLIDKKITVVHSLPSSH